MNKDSDPRNLIDKFKGLDEQEVIARLDTDRSELEIAVENLERDFNMGTIVRNANAFNVARVHVVGRRQWNKRGAMKTDAYMHIMYHQTVTEFMEYAKAHSKSVIAVDIVEGATPLHDTPLPKNALLVFGAEGPGLSDELLTAAERVTHIEQFGSTRSVNVGVASGIAMYAWMQQHRLS